MRSLSLKKVMCLVYDNLMATEVYKVALLHQHGGGHSYRIELQSSTFHMKCFVTSVLTERDLYTQ